MNTVPSEPTPNHQPEQAIESSPVSLDQRATEILDSITDGFFALDREWRFTYLNRQGLRILARSAGDLVGKVLWEVYPGLEQEPGRRMTVSDVIAAARTAGAEALSIEHFMLTPGEDLDQIRGRLLEAGLDVKWARGHPDGRGNRRF